MKKLVLLSILLSSSVLTLCMHRPFLQQAKAEKQISSMNDWLQLRQVRQSLQSREDKIKYQTNSFFERIKHFYYDGLGSFSAGSVCTLSAYIITHKNSQNGVPFLNQNFWDLMSCFSLGAFGTYYLVKGTKTLYNSTFNWKNRKQRKLNITQDALGIVQKRQNDLQAAEDQEDTEERL